MSRKPYVQRDPEAYRQARREAALKRWAVRDPETRRKITRPAIDARLAKQQQQVEPAA